ncbi:hypothetical protein KGQ27_03450 [Patescibacteria group bacterium]|nr:hypothetical protein [Patescibacteria group bacterium]MDE1946908.1 hypothetical protein [Patescibacteria group bacterium]MDE2011109.1 hypothetical protein [Patescibacteria group bacterium]MDE2233199.1 hypothetical protein [Patescibacteria group bacterium]
MDDENAQNAPAAEPAAPAVPVAPTPEPTPEPPAPTPCAELSEGASIQVGFLAKKVSNFVHESAQKCEKCGIAGKRRGQIAMLRA